MPYHPRLTGLPTLERNTNLSWASVGTDKYRYHFLIVPEKIKWTYNNSFSKLNVAYSDSELVKFQHASFKITIPDIKFWTPNNDKDLSEDMDKLVGLSRPSGGDVQSLSFEYGSANIYPVYIEMFSYTEEMRTGGRLVKASGQMNLVGGYEPDSEQLKDAVRKANLELTLKQRILKAAEVEKYFNDNPQLRRGFRFALGVPITVDGKGNVYQGSIKLGTLSEILK